MFETMIIYLSKAYENLDPGRLLRKLAGYGAGPKLQGLLAEFWSWQEVVAFQNGFHGPQFREARGKTQVGLASTTLFNMEVDSVVHQWLSLTVEEISTTHDGLGMTVGMCMGVFYVDDRMIRSRDPEWLQGAINILIWLFRNVGLMSNVAK